MSKKKLGLENAFGWMGIETQRLNFLIQLLRHLAELETQAPVGLQQIEPKAQLLQGLE